MSKSRYDKDTYIGYLKLKHGGMKIVPGEIDNSIIQFSGKNRLSNHLLNQDM